MREKTGGVGRALVACLRENASAHPGGTFLADALSRPDPQMLLAAARAHRVSPFVLEAIRASGAEIPALEEGLVEDQRTLVSTQLRTSLDLSTLGQALEEAGVPWLVFKGPALAHLAYARPDRRRYDDLDVLTPPAAFPAAVRALEGAGFTVLDRNWNLIRREGRGQLHLIHPSGSMVDLHWHLLNRASVRRSFSVDIDQVFERARAIELDGRRVRTLHASDTLVHTCLHAALSGAGRLLWVMDVDGLLTREADAWIDIEAKARGWRARSPVAIMLERVRRIMGSEIPADLRARLFGSSTRARIDRVLDRRWPLETSTSELSPATVWAEVQRDRAVELAAAAFRRGTRRPLTLARGGHGGRGGAGAVMLPDGSRMDREAFLRDVERTMAV